MAEWHDRENFPALTVLRDSGQFDFDDEPDFFHVCFNQSPRYANRSPASVYDEQPSEPTVGLPWQLACEFERSRLGRREFAWLLSSTAEFENTG